MSVVREVVGEGLDAMDRRVLPWVYGLASVEPAEVRARLRAQGLAVHDPAGGAVRPAALERTVDRLIDDAAGRAGSTGAVAGLAGAAGIAPEAVAWLVDMVRLIQAMAVAYGLDPTSSRGRVAVTRAIAEGFEIAVPDEGVLDARVTALVRGSTVGSRLVRGLAARATWQAGGRVLRWIPGVAAMHAAVDGPRRTRVVAGRARQVLQRASRSPAPVPSEEAVEIAEP